MSNEKINSWIDTLERELGFRKVILLHGNVEDECFNNETKKYERVRDVIPSILKSRGFKDVIVWDPIGGIQNVSVETIDRLRKKAVTDAADGSVNTAGKSNGYLSNDELKEFEAVDGAGQNPALSGKNMKDPKDFFAAVMASMNSADPGRTAFIVDYSQYLFGSPENLSECERNWLTTISKAVASKNAAISAKDSDKPASVIVFIASSETRLPSSFFNNPCSSKIRIPLPGRKERVHYVNENKSKFRMSKPLSGDAFEDFIDLLDDFTLAEIAQIIKLSRQLPDMLTPEKLVNLYKYGEKTSPWEDLDKKKLERMDETLKKRVIGQDQAIARVVDVVINACTGLSGLHHSAKQKKPKGCLFFVGPTGVGKTELAKAVAEFIFGDENACIRFDMSEYSHEQSDQRLLGAPPGYVGYENGGQLTNAISAKPFSVILFDEIEKAHSRILDKFLQILEDGRLTDGLGKTVSFSESVIIFTSNIGACEVDFSNDYKVVGDQFKEKVEEHFKKIQRPELFNRIGDNIIPFNFISDGNFKARIARAKFNPVIDFVFEKYKVELYFENEKEIFRAIAAASDNKNGGRGVLNVMDTHIIKPLSRFLFVNLELLCPGKRIKIYQINPGDAPCYFELE